MREKIRSLLSQRKRAQMVNAFVLKHLANEKVEAFLPSPKLVVQLGRSDGPAVWTESARRAAVLFSDLTCEAGCASAGSAIVIAEQAGVNIANLQERVSRSFEIIVRRISGLVAIVDRSNKTSGLS